MHYYLLLILGSSRISGRRSTTLQHPVPAPVSPLGPTPTVLTTSSTPHAHPPQSDRVDLHQVHPPSAGSQLEQQSAIQLISNWLTLPKPELLKCNGDPMDYIRFINNFETNISSCLPNPKDKLQYLIQNCEGRAKVAIKDMVVLEPSKGYSEAMITLKDLFGRPHIIARTYVEEIVNGEPLKNNDTCALSELANKMKLCSYTLQSMGYETDVNNTNNLLKIVRRLPLHIKAKWVDRADRIIEGGREPSFEDLCDFIAVRGRVANNVFGQDLSTPFYNNSRFTTKRRKYDRQRVITMATGGEVQHSIYTPTVCRIYCNGSHKLWNCEKLKSANYNEIRRFMREKRLCDNWLQYGHVSGRCSRNKYCRQKDCTVAYKHHELLHPPPKIKSDVTVATTCHAKMPQTRKVFLRAVPVTVRSSCGAAVDTYAMLDECSTATLCSKQLAQQLK